MAILKGILKESLDYYLVTPEKVVLKSDPVIDGRS